MLLLLLYLRFSVLLLYLRFSVLLLYLLFSVLLLYLLFSVLLLYLLFSVLLLYLLFHHLQCASAACVRNLSSNARPIVTSPTQPRPAPAVNSHTVH